MESVMKWSWKLGRAFGIDVYLHATFALLLGWVAVSTYLRTRDVSTMVSGVTFMLVVFASVLFHELGHALTARRYGIRTRDITLLPIGGVARLERMPDKPAQELVVALAGPLVNVGIAAVLVVAHLTTGHALTDMGDLAHPGPMLTRLLWVNVGLAIFNLVPAFPMDGGRALRALLAMRGNYVRATQTAARLGQGIALLFGVLGLMFNPMLAFIALFVWIGAASEAAGVEMRASLHAFPIRNTMQTEFHTLSTHDTLAIATERLLTGSQGDFPVLDPRGALVGVLTRKALVAGLAARGPDSTVGEAMERTFSTAAPSEMLDVALERLGVTGTRCLPVVADDHVVGMVTSEHIAELMMVREALAVQAKGGAGASSLG